MTTKKFENRRGSGSARRPKLEPFTTHLDQLFVQPSRPRSAVRMRYALVSSEKAKLDIVTEGLIQSGKSGMPRLWLDPNYLVAFGQRLKRPKLNLPNYLSFIEQRTMSDDGIVGYGFTVSQILYWRQKKFNPLGLNFDRIYVIERRNDCLESPNSMRFKGTTHPERHTDGSDFSNENAGLENLGDFYENHLQNQNPKHQYLWLDDSIQHDTARQTLNEDIIRVCKEQPDPAESVHQEAKSSQHFRVWAFGCAHVGTDLRKGRESLASAIQHSEWGSGQTGPAFRWDIAVGLGDMCGSQKLPEDSEGREVVRQFGTLMQHNRSEIYNLCGNHDRSGLHEPEAWWFRKWLDPTGENTEFSNVVPEQRPFPIDGTWERYSFRVGNLLFLMMSDINEKSQSKGRGELGGNPAGVVSGETFSWWKDMVESNPESIIITSHHYVLKNTTVASGEWEGFRKNKKGEWTWHYHGYKPEGAPRGASYLYFVDGVEDAQCFEKYLAKHPSASAMWLGAHTHTHPDDTYGGKSHIETRWGCHFVNVSALTRYHGRTCFPMSRRLTFTEGCDQVTIECYLHSDKFKQPGWYSDKTKTLKLPRPFVRHPVS